MSLESVQPAYHRQTFICPGCGVLSRHEWFALVLLRGIVNMGKLEDVEVSICSGENCGHKVFWKDDELAFPEALTVPKPDPDMPSDVQALYNEAATVLPRSARAAAVLIRVALQVLIPYIDPASTGKLMQDIGNLTTQGFDPEVINAFDLVRLLGDDGAHPESIMLGQSVAEASELFFLINYISNSYYTRQRAKKRITEMHAAIPADKQKWIDDRNRGVASKTSTT